MPLPSKNHFRNNANHGFKLWLISLLLIYYDYHLFILPDPAAAAASQANKEEVDSRSVFVGNVRLCLINL